MYRTEKISFEDGHEVDIQVYSANSSVTYLFMPALGVRASYYLPFVEALQQESVNTVLMDYRGKGTSSVRASSKVDFGYETLIQDMAKIGDHIHEIFPSTNLVVGGHSLGGQVGCLLAARYPEKVVGILKITSCLVYHKGWSGWGNVQVRMAGTLFPLIARIVGHFPGEKVGFGGREGKTLMKDWGHNALTGRYELTGTDFNYESALHNTLKPLLSISLKGDFMASYQAVKNLYEKLHPDSPLTHHHISAEEVGIEKLNHFNWVKKPGYVAKLLADWLKETFR
ncbi:MAG: alpha/beta fold hydrolase [Bacteroidota bacterium]